MKRASTGKIVPTQGESEMIRNLVDSIMAYVDESLADARIHSAVVPIERIKTLSKLIANKADTVPFECSALDTCMRYDPYKRDEQLEQYRDSVRDVISLALEAQLNTYRLERSFVGRDQR